MPDKPLWLDRLPHALRQLEQSPDPWIDRTTLQSLLGVGRRRAQQLLAPLARRRVGTSLLAHRSTLIAHLESIRTHQQTQYEERRQQLLWSRLSQARQAYIEQPPVLVEVSHAQIRRVLAEDLAGLPEGVELGPGSITVRFTEPEDALRKLMALAMAISRNRLAFDQQVSLPRP